MRHFMIMLASIALAGCGGDATTAPTATIAGTWNLKSINGTPLPFTLAQTGTNKLELMSDVFVISGTGSFTQTTTLRSTTNGVPTTQSLADAGSYVLNGTAV